MGVELSGAHYAARDLAASPLTYQGFQRTFHMTYGYRGVRSRHELRIPIMCGDLASSTEGDTQSSHFGLDYAYRRHAARTLGDRIDVFAGFCMENSFYAREYHFLSGNPASYPDKVRPFSTLERTSWEFMSSLGPSVEFEYALGSRNELGLRLSFPLLTYLHRPGYALGPPEGMTTEEPSFGDIVKTGEIVSVNTVFRISTTLSFGRTLTSWLGIGSEYQFVYYSIKEPRESSAVVNRIGLLFFVIV